MFATGGVIPEQGSVLQVPESLSDEFLQTLAQSKAVRIERIVSHGHVTPEGEWYDQALNEFVLLVEGAARLAYADGRTVELSAGDWLVIPAHEKHRVAWTDPDRHTIWLAVHYR